MPKTLYLWDLANTLFPEKWNAELTGYATFEDYVKATVKNPNDPRQFESAFQEPYIHGEMYNLAVADGFKEVLSWTKNNEAFTTGVKEQMDWRAVYLNPRVGFDVKSYFKKINTTFDFAETNVKSKKMIVRYLSNKVSEGYDTIVYTDDKLANCQLFQEAVNQVQRENPGLNCRIYHVLNSSSAFCKRSWYFEIGNLKDFLESEKLSL